jgi:acyl-CoA thioesterase FadM
MPLDFRGVLPVPITAPFVSSVMEIQPDWIDYNGHMNMAFYTVLFDRCADEAYEPLGLGPDYAQTRRCTTYTAEFHVCYLRELHLSDRVTSTFQLLDHDEKRFHVFQELRHVDGWLAAPEGRAPPARHSGKGAGDARGAFVPALAGARGPRHRHSKEGAVVAGQALPKSAEF